MMPIKGSNLYHFNKNELPNLFKQAKRVLRHPAMDILISPKKFDYCRILAVTPKKIGNAVKRNKVRRRVKSIFFEQKLFEKDHDIVVIVKKESINLPFDKLKKLLVGALS